MRDALLGRIRARLFAVSGAGFDDYFLAVIALDGNSAVDQARLHQSGPRGIAEIHGNAIRARWRLRLPAGRPGGKRNAENCSSHNEGWETLSLVIHDLRIRISPFRFSTLISGPPEFTRTPV